MLLSKLCCTSSFTAHLSSLIAPIPSLFVSPTPVADDDEQCWGADTATTDPHACYSNKLHSKHTIYPITIMKQMNRFCGKMLLTRVIKKI